MEIASFQKEIKKKLARAQSLAFDWVLKDKGDVCIEITSHWGGATINSIGGIDATHPYFCMRFKHWPHLYEDSDGDAIRVFYANQIGILNHWIKLLK